MLTETLADSVVMATQTTALLITIVRIKKLIKHYMIIRMHKCVI